MNNLLKFSTAALLACLAAANVNAGVIDSISTSNSGNGDEAFSTVARYGYLFTIEQHDADLSIYHATLTNTSEFASPESLIDEFAFNMNSARLGSDFIVTDMNLSDWSISDATGGVQFDYVGTDAVNGSGAPIVLGTGESLTFNFDFLTLQAAGDFSFWLNSAEKCGSGFGGGGDCGQVAVSFQQLGAGGQYSDLLASNWERDTTTVPEPGALALMGLGLLGMAAARRRKQS